MACWTAELMRERISRLVFVDALTLFDGEKVADILPHSTAVADGVTLRPSPEDVANRLFADLDPKQAGRTAVAERPVVPLKPGNAGGGKGPQFKTDARRGEGPGDWAT